MNRDKISITSVTQSLSERGIIIVDPKGFAQTIGELHENPFAPEPIPFTNPYAGFKEYAYTPDLSGNKKRKCSNKKYVKRKKARNGR